MAKKKSIMARVPKDYYDRIDQIGEKFDVPNTDAFKLHEKMLSLDFTLEKKKKKKKNKNVFEVSFEL